MKKNIYKFLATSFAVVLIAASPATSITSHALGFNPGAHDDTDYGYRPDDYGQNWSNDGGSSDSGSSDSGSSDSGSGNSGSGFNQNAHDDTDYGERPGDYGEKKDSNDVIVRVTDGQPFRSVMNKEHTAYEVYHKGVSVAAFTVTDAKGNVVTFSAVKLEKGADGLWYLNITLPEGVDVKGLTVALIKGDLAYLARELGISGIQLNGTVMLLTAPAEEEKSNETDAGSGSSADTEKSDKKGAETPKTETPATGSESTAVGARICWCGYHVDIANKGGLSAAEKAAWKTHAAAHLTKGESTSYTDVAY